LNGVSGPPTPPQAPTVPAPTLARVRQRLRGLGARVGASVAYFSELRWWILIGVLVRLCLWMYSSQADLTGFASQSVTMAYGGHPYTFGSNYPPSWPLFLNLVGRTAAVWVPPSGFLQTFPLNGILVNQIGTLEPPALVTPFYSVVEKSFLLPFDLGTGLALYYLVRTGPFRQLEPRTVFALWFLNPLIVTVSSLHGNYDVLSAFFVLVALLLVFQGDYLFAGISVGIATSLELYPLFLVPIFLAFLARNQSFVAAAKRGLEFVAGGAVAAVVVLWPPSLLHDFITSFGTGPGVGNQFGGFWIWSLVSIPWSPLHRLSNLLTQNSIDVSLACAAVAVVLVLYLAARWIRARGPEPGLPAVTTTLLAAILAVYFVLPIVQPQNLIWLLPYLLLACCWANRVYRIPFAVVSVAPVVYDLVVLGGPLYYFQQLAEFTHLVSPQTVIASVTQFAGYQPTLYPLVLVPTFGVLLFVLVTSLRSGRRYLAAR
jgi:hypothetical protein